MKKQVLLTGFIMAIFFLMIVQMGSTIIAQERPQMGGALRYGTNSAVPNLDPHVYTTSSGKVINLCIYNSLLGYNKKGELVPALVESWENPDPKTYIFKLRKGVTFHKGQAFSARDVKYSLERILDPGFNATLRSSLEGISVNIIDDYTVRIESKEPNVPLVVNLAMPEAAIISEDWMKTNPNIKVEANGTGPFSLEQHEPRVRVLLKRNPNYYEKGLPYLDQVEIKMISNDDARVNALRTRELDMIDFVPWKDINLLKKEKGLAVQTAGGAFMNLWFNTSKRPFDDPRVRRAVSFAIDREGISKAAFFGYGTPLSGPPTPPEAWFFNKDLSKTFSYDPEKAKKLLSEAGYPKGFKAELLVYQAFAIYTQTAQIVQANLKEVGIDVDIKLLEWPTVVDRKDKAQYDFLIWGVNIKLPDPDAYSYYFGSQSTYWAKPIGFADQKIDDLLKIGRSTINNEKRKEIYHELEKRILELNPWTFINWRDQAQAYVNKVKGFVQLGGALSENAPGIAMKTLWFSK